jgi:hypothetical protein
VRRGRTGWDGDRLAHNPEVAGSNPAPATSFRSSRPFPSRERASCVPGTVVKGVVGAELRAAWRQDGGDGAARDETAWTWWTLPPAIAGCPARRSHRQPPVSSHPWWTRPNARSRSAVSSARRMSVLHPVTRSARTSQPFLELTDGVADRTEPVRLRLRPAHCAICLACLQPARITDLYCIGSRDKRRPHRPGR